MTQRLKVLRRYGKMKKEALAQWLIYCLGRRLLKGLFLFWIRDFQNKQRVAEALMDKEVWKAVKGYEGFYEVSSHGSVRSLPMLRRNRGGAYYTSGKVLKKTNREGRYYTVNLAKDKKHRHWYIHRLVAGAFCKKKKGHNVVNHINFNRFDNYFKNLEWCTTKHNVNHSKVNRKEPHTSVPISINIDGVSVSFLSIKKCSEYLNVPYHQLQSFLKRNGSHKLNCKSTKALKNVSFS
jgi:hypothetical protein